MRKAVRGARAPLFCVPGRGAWPTLRVGEAARPTYQTNVTVEPRFLRSNTPLWKTTRCRGAHQHHGHHSDASGDEEIAFAARFWQDP